MFTLKNIKWEFIGLLILAVFPLFPFFLVSVAIAIYLLFSVLERVFHKKEPSTLIFNKKFFLIQISFFVFLLIISGLKNGFTPTFKYLEPSISLLFFPVIWYITQTKITKKERKIVLKNFLISSLLLGLYISLYSTYFILNNNHVNYAKLHEQIPFLSIHPHYVGLYFFISIVLLYYENLFKNSTIKHIAISFFVLLILAMASRAILLVLILFFVVEFIKNKNSYKKKATTLSIVILSVFLAFYFIKPLQKKIIEVSSLKQFELPNKKWPTSSQIRIGLNHCAKPILKQNFSFGAGILTFEKELNTCYSKFNNQEKTHYNSHNYYVFLIGSAGIFCLFLFLLMLFWHFKIGFKNKNKTYLYFLLLIVISLFTENILSRVYGVIFILFFMTIFVKSTTRLNQKK